MKEVVGRPIAFASTGEKLDDFDQFHPDRMADRILGMGDVLSLIEQAERTMDKEVATKGAAAMMEGRFTLEDFLEQLQQVKKMGSVSGMLSLLPGVPKDLKQASSADRRPPDRPGRGHHPLDDPGRADRPVDHRRCPPGPDRQRQRHRHLGCQCAPQAVQGDAEDDEGDREGRHGRGHGRARRPARPRPEDVARRPWPELAEMAAGTNAGGADPSARWPGWAGSPGARRGRADGLPGGSGGQPRGSSKSKGKGGKKGKGGGRVTPKAR